MISSKLESRLILKFVFLPKINTKAEQQQSWRLWQHSNTRLSTLSKTTYNWEKSMQLFKTSCDMKSFFPSEGLKENLYFNIIFM